MSDKDKQLQERSLIVNIKEIISSARQSAYTAVNSAMVKAYWDIGEKIVEEEQKGEAKAQYGSKLIPTLSKELTTIFGSGFSVRYLRDFRKFYLTFKDLDNRLPIWQTVFTKLSWSHIRMTLRVTSLELRGKNLAVNFNQHSTKCRRAAGAPSTS